MRRNKTLNDCVRFAAWCRNNNVRPSDAADLITLAHRAHSAGGRAANGGPADPERRRGGEFESMAHSLGFGVSWCGLWPTLTRGGYDVELPAIG